MKKSKFPIIVRNLANSKEWASRFYPGEKRFHIYCMAPFVNAFNEVIEVSLTKEWGGSRLVWGASKGSSGTIDQTDTKLVAEGYAIAVRLMAGDESMVTPEPLVKKFLTRYRANLRAQERRGAGAPYRQ